MAPDDSGWRLAEEKRLAESGRGRIRCPGCKYRPHRRDQWLCDCGHEWNTFDTRGLCPACGKQWTETCCPRCGEWSPHDDWYAPADRPDAS